MLINNLLCEKDHKIPNSDLLPKFRSLLGTREDAEKASVGSDKRICKLSGNPARRGSDLGKGKGEEGEEWDGY